MQRIAVDESVVETSRYRDGNLIERVMKGYRTLLRFAMAAASSAGLALTPLRGTRRGKRSAIGQQVLELKDGRIVNATALFDSIEFNEFWRRVVPAA